MKKAFGYITEGWEVCEHILFERACSHIAPY